ncbi:MAG: FHA domain-containing protein [Chloroflexota bacterium]
MLVLIFLLSSFILYSSSPASAQGAAFAEIAVPDTRAFPTIMTFLDVYDGAGQFVSGLKPEAVTILEDGQPRPVQALTEAPVGAQLVVAVNPGPALDVRDGQGITRYLRLQQALGTWAQARDVAAEGDDLSLVTLAGPLIAHAAPADWLVTFASFQPDFRSTTPNIQTLALALDTASVPTPQVGMKRAILFITPHMEAPDLEAALGSIAQRAAEARVRIFVWFVDADVYLSHPSAALFQALAVQTGGTFFAFTGSEPIPDPEAYFAPLRRVYQLTYASGLAAGGEHTLAVQVNTQTAGLIVSAERTFSLDIQPPNPILVAPPQTITRAAPPEDPYNTEVLVPNEQPIEIIVEFPDGHPRPLVRTALYVDGQLVDENLVEPFDKFVWDISAYAEGGQHTLVVEANDSLGLGKASIGVPVVVNVVRPPTGAVVLLARNRYLIVVGAVALAGLVLLGILLSGRVRIRSRRERRAARERSVDPVTQPVTAVIEPPTEPKKRVRRLAKTGPGSGKVDAPAYLLRLGADGQPVTANPIPLDAPELTFGTDPVHAAVILDDPSVSPLHARIRQAEDGFIIYDQGSVAGTWANYEPVTREGYRLKHGDRVHFGQMTYRFELKNTPAPPSPKITAVS